MIRNYLLMAGRVHDGLKFAGRIGRFAERSMDGLAERRSRKARLPDCVAREWSLRRRSRMSRSQFPVG